MILRKGTHQLYDILKKAGVFFLATVDGERARARPISAMLMEDDRLMFVTGSEKDMYRQMLDKPWVEIAALVEDGWLRCAGRVVFEADPKYAEMYLQSAPEMRESYNDKTGNRIMMFHLEDAQAHLITENSRTEIDI